MPEFACITFKTKPSVKQPEPCFSVFKGNQEVCSLPISSIPTNLVYPDSKNRQRIYQLSASSSFLKGNILSKEFNNYHGFFFQNYLVSIWFQHEQRFEFQEFQVQWIKTKNTSDNKSYEIQIKLIGLKDLIFTNNQKEEIVRYGLFPLLENKFVSGNQLLLQIRKSNKENLNAQIEYEFIAIQLKFVKYINQFNYQQKLTNSRYLMTDHKILVETYIRDLFTFMHEHIFQPNETLSILKQVNRRIINSIPMKFDFFIDYIGFKDENVLQNNKNNNFFILKNQERQFLPAEVLDGMTILEILYDRENMSNEINQNLVNLFEKTLNYTKNNFINEIQSLIQWKQSKRFGFSILETILTKQDVHRIEEMVDQGILLLPKESLQLNIDLKPLVEDLLQNNNILVADDMITSIQLSPIDQTRKYNFLMFLIPFIQKFQITGEELPSFFKFFQNYQTRQEQAASQIVKFQSDLPFNLVKKYQKNKINMNSSIRSFQLAFDEQNDYLISQVQLDQDLIEKRKSLKSKKCIRKLYNLFFEEQYSQLEYKYIDFQYYTLSKKIMNISTLNEVKQFNKIKTNGMGVSMFELAELCENVSDLNQDQLQQMDIIRNLIDHQFQITQFIQLTNFIIFVILYIIPFTIQLVTDQEDYTNKPNEFTTNWVKLCNIICMATATYFEMIELTQLFNKQHFYFNNYSNFAEQGMFIVNCIYFVFRLHNNGMYLPKMKHLDPSSHQNDLENEHTKTVSIYAVILNTAMIIFIFLKINTWMRLFDKFSNLQTNVKESVKDMLLFLFYFAYWVVFLSMIFYGIGGTFYLGDDAEEAYQGVRPIVAQLIQVFRNSIGDIGVPQYQYWLIREQKADEDQIAAIFIFFIWVFFVANEILMLIVLLNFLIAIVSESYTRVNEIQVRFNYRQKAELNQETFLLVKFFFFFCPCFKKFKHFNLYIIEQEMKQYPDSDNQTFSKITETVNQIVDPLNHKLQSLQNIMKNIVQVVQNLDSSKNSINTELHKHSESQIDINRAQIQHQIFRPGNKATRIQQNTRVLPKLQNAVEEVIAINQIQKKNLSSYNSSDIKKKKSTITNNDDQEVKLMSYDVDKNYFDVDARNLEEPSITIGPANLIIVNKKYELKKD